ncbi:MAG: maltose alpha-D-glucosyltransferase [Candidatus Binatus sp.]|uniref:maltose alpha-D-glucosyltransferase n=1 Tax=Candidatus Binatus sp. TaxID=2811406 RepID=UPI003C764F2F
MLTNNQSENGTKSDLLWYKNAIFYELRVRSFYDSNGDGVGDFPGLTAKLDYLQSLGVTTLWLLPFYPSPMRDDGYDIADYTNVHPDCGTLRDFKLFIREAHRHDLRVITELVLNHTSDRHQWFQRARRSPAGSMHRDYYIWSDTPERYKDARIIFQDFEPSNWSWDPVAKAYYFHRFYSHQPDLNYDNPAVVREIRRVISFWMGLGVDGLRLDAVPYLFKREGTNCENLPETHAFLRELRAYIDARFADRMLLAEANQWPEEAVAYLAEGKECNMAFHFPLMPRMFMSVRMEDRFPLTDIWSQTPRIDPTCQWALFLRNHDELTLEMVTDEERDYMYRAYAQDARMRVNLGIRRRLAPLLGNHRRTIELNNALLFSLPGSPFIYYGDEIGMGDNVYLGDRDAVRTPMQWSADRNAGFSSANPQRLILPVIIDPEYHYQSVNVEAHESNRHSLLWWMRRLVALRKQIKAFGCGSIEFLNPENSHVLAFIRAHENQLILVVTNLSRFVQYVELDLARFKGSVPIELFGRTPFPPIGDLPYLLTLGPHGFFWFSLEQPATGAVEQSEYVIPRIEIRAGFDGSLHADAREELERLLPRYLPYCRWFRAKTGSITGVRIASTVTMMEGPAVPQLALLNVEYSNSEPETYLLPLAIATGDRGREVRTRWPEHVIAEVNISGRNGDGDGILYDAAVDPEFLKALLETIARRRRHRASFGELISGTTQAFHQLRGDPESPLEPRVLKGEQSNSSAVYGDRFIVKLFRRIEAGVNPDLEIGRFLTSHERFSHVPPLAGWIDYRAGNGERKNLAMLQGFVPNEGDAWQFTLGELDRFLENAATRSDPAPSTEKTLIELLELPQPDLLAVELVGHYLDAARLMGRRLAELHLALASTADDPDFAPESYSTLHQRSTFQSMQNLLARVMRTLNSRAVAIPAKLRDQVQLVASHQNLIAARFDSFLRCRLSVTRMRIHGDLHLGQMLYTGKDFAIIDFEGEPARPLSERRRKRSALRDVAGMLRSFHYAALTSTIAQLRTGALGKFDFAGMRPWTDLWRTWSSWSFLRGYLEAAGPAPFVPKGRDELRILLDTYVMEKAVYELGYELNNRPDWLLIPLLSIGQLLGLESTFAQDVIVSKPGSHESLRA